MDKKADLKTRQPLVMRIGLIIVLCVIIIILILFPRFEKKSVRILGKDNVIFVIPDVPVTEQKIETPEPPKSPRIPIEVDAPDDTTGFDWMPNVDIESFINYNFPPPPPPPPTSDKAIPYLISTEMPQVIGQIKVEYPDIARDVGLEGTVFVQAYIDEKGTVRKCEVIKGFPNSGLDEAAIAAIRKAKFRPARERDVNVGVNIVIPVVFILDK